MLLEWPYFVSGDEANKRIYPNTQPLSSDWRSAIQLQASVQVTMVVQMAVYKKTNSPGELENPLGSIISVRCDVNHFPNSVAFMRIAGHCSNLELINRNGGFVPGGVRTVSAQRGRAAWSWLILRHSTHKTLCWIHVHLASLPPHTKSLKYSWTIVDWNL